MSSFWYNIFSKIGQWLVHKENLQSGIVTEVLENFNNFTIGMISTIISTLFALFLIKTCLAIPRLLSKLADRRRLKFVEIQKALIHKQQESLYLNEELKKLTNIVAELNEINCSNNEKFENLEAERADFENSSKLLQQEKEFTSNLNEDLKILLQTKELEIEQLSAENSHNSSSIRKISSEIASKDDEILLMKNDLERLKLVEETCSRQEILIENVLAQFLMDSNSEITDDVSSLKKIVEDLQSPNELRSNYLSCLKRLSQSEDKVVELRSQLEVIEATVSARDSQIVCMKKEMNDLEGRISLTNDLLNSTMNQIYEEKAEMLLLTREKSQLEKKITEYETNACLHRAHLKEYDSLIDAVRHARNLMEDKYRTAQLVVGKHVQTISELEEKIVSLECSLNMEKKINESNRPFVQSVPPRELHPCLLSFMNESNLPKKTILGNSAVVGTLNELKRGDALNVYDYRFPTNEQSESRIPTDLSSVGSDFTRGFPISSNQSSRGQISSFPVSETNPLMSTFVDQSTRSLHGETGSGTARYLNPNFQPNFPNYEFYERQTHPNNPLMANMAQNYGVPGQYPESTASSIRTGSCKQTYPAVRKLENFPAPVVSISEFFTPQSAESNQFEDPFATIGNVGDGNNGDVQCDDNREEKLSNVSSTEIKRTTQVPSSNAYMGNVDYF